MSEATTAWLLQQGWPGFIIILLVGVVVWLVKQNGSLAKQNAEANDAVREENLALRQFIREIQDKRVAETQAVAHTATAALTNFAGKAEAVLDALAARSRR